MRNLALYLRQIFWPYPLKDSMELYNSDFRKVDAGEKVTEISDTVDTVARFIGLAFKVVGLIVALMTVIGIDPGAILTAIQTGCGG